VPQPAPFIANVVATTKEPSDRVHEALSSADKRGEVQEYAGDNGCDNEERKQPLGRAGRKESHLLPSL